MLSNSNFAMVLVLALFAFLNAYLHFKRKPESPLRISMVAIKYLPSDRVYALGPPNRHHNVIDLMCESLGIDAIATCNMEQGFMTSKGDFVTREQALKIAIEANQLIGTRVGSRLFTENLW